MDKKLLKIGIKKTNNRLIFFTLLILCFGCVNEEEYKYKGKSLCPVSLHNALFDSLIKEIYLPIDDSIQLESKKITTKKIGIWNQGDNGCYSNKHDIRISFNDYGGDESYDTHDLQLRYKGKLLHYNGVFTIESEKEIKEDTLFIEVMGRKDKEISHSWWTESNLIPLDTLVVPLKNKLVIEWFEGN